MRLLRILYADRARQEACIGIYNGGDNITFRRTRNSGNLLDDLTEVDRDDDTSRGGRGIAPQHVAEARQMAAQALA